MLEALLYFKAAGRFNRDAIEQVGLILPWDVDRLKKMEAIGFIVLFRKGLNGKRKALYELTYQAKCLVNAFYKIIETGEFPDSRCLPHNRLKAAKADKKYARYFKQVNQEKKDEEKKGRL